MSGEVVVDKRLLAKTRVREDPGALDLLLRLSAPPERVIAALKSMVRETPDSDGLAEWSWARVGEHVVLEIRESWDYERDVLELAEQLGAKGLAGRLELYERPAIPPPPGGDYYLEARMRVGRHDDDMLTRWRFDQAEFEIVVRRAVAWCFEPVPRAAAILSVRDLDACVLDATEDIADRMVAELAPADPVEGPRLASVRPVGGTRTVFAVRVLGEVQVFDRPVRAAGAVWKAPYRDIRTLLREMAPRLGYALVKHGVNSTVSSLEFDWPRRPGLGRSTRDDMWDTRAPDAFALQVLGPGYPREIPPAPSYETERIGDSTILEHRDLGAWFAEPFVPRDTHFTQVPDVYPPQVLTDARNELAPILWVPRRRAG